MALDDYPRYYPPVQPPRQPMSTGEHRMDDSGRPPLDYRLERFVREGREMIEQERERVENKAKARQTMQGWEREKEQKRLAEMRIQLPGLLPQDDSEEDTFHNPWVYRP